MIETPKYEALPEHYVAVIGGGPAGLMAAEKLAEVGFQVVVFEAKPSLGRKFLRAGIGGLNLTHGEDFDRFCSRFEDKRAQLQPMLDRFSPSDLRRWAAELGVETFEGSSGRVFPESMKAAPLLRAWIHRLRDQGVQFRLRHRWLGWDADGALRVATGGEESSIRPSATILALGGGSWPQLGSDAAWVPWLQSIGVQVTTLESANCGFGVEWSDHLRQKFAGAQVKPVSLCFTDLQGNTANRVGEFVITDYGVEGSLIYSWSRPLRETINARGSATVFLDLLPGRTMQQVEAALSAPRGARSLSSHLQGRLNFKGVKVGLLREVVGKALSVDATQLAHTIKNLPLHLTAARPLVEAISTAGGVAFDAVNDHLMLKGRPGVFVAGEMLDWEAPTGGYLLTACMAQGAWAANGVSTWLNPSS